MHTFISPFIYYTISYMWVSILSLILRFGLWFYDFVSDSTILSLILRFCVWFYDLSLILQFCLWFYDFVSDSTILSLILRFCLWFYDFVSDSTIFATGFWNFSDNVVFFCFSFYYNINIFLQKQQVHMIEKQITSMIVKR